MVVKGIHELKPRLYELRNEVRETPCHVGLPELDNLYTPRKGYPLFIAGAPHHGKSLFVKWLLVEWSERYDWNHFVYMGEEGGSEELAIDLIEIHCGHPARRNNYQGQEQDCISDEEFAVAVEWVGNHFDFYDPDEQDLEFTPDQFYATCQGKEYDTTVLDPWNDVARNLKEAGGREDVWLTNELKKVRQHSRKHNRIDIVINHIAKLHADTTTTSGKRYQKPALPQEWAGGQAWYRRAFTMLLVFRPPVGEVLKEGEDPIRDGETWIINQKTKPKGSGQLGLAKLFLCRTSNRLIQ